MSLSVEDRLDIHQLLNLYGHLIDERQFSRLGEIFTDAAVFDLGEFDGSRFEGLPAIVRMMQESEQHPLAHHATNIVLECDGEAVIARSKGIGVGPGGRVGSVTYRDQLVRTGQGWRVAERCCSLRRVEGIPEPS